ncbi:MAG: S8 family peptidase [Flavobacteriales bacterium]|nr:S8 family peptidase [Flavobacteriales bacterium]
MKKIWSLLIVLTLIGVNVYAQKADYVKGEIIIQLNHGQNIERVLSRVNEDLGAGSPIALKKVLTKRLNIWLLEFDESKHGIHRVIGTLNSYGAVRAAQKNHLIEQRVTVPNDALYNSMWDMDNLGQSGGTNDADIDAPEAWDITTGGLTANGDTIVVAVIDGGFDIGHEDLNFWKNHHEIPGNGIDDDGNGYIDDFDGWNAYNSTGTLPSNAHGTHVAGTVGAIGNNSIGVTGVNWDVRVMPIAGSSSSSESTVVEAYGYVFELRATYNETNGDSGAFVVSTNSSFGVDNGDPAQFPIWCAFYDTLGSVGVLSCGATMNSNSDVDQTGDVPTACPSPYMISVTNTDRNDQKNSGAAFGLTTIDLGAPGTTINSTTPGNNYSDQFTGTSMATPHVAGAIGLLYAAPCASLSAIALANPDVAALDVRQYILDGVDVIPSLTGKTVTGGRLNLFNSVMEVINNCSGFCAKPSQITATSIISAGAIMTWNDISGISYNVRYAVSGDTNWTTATTTNPTFNLVGLMPCTTYEFQVGTVCDTASSGFTTGFTFMTTCIPVSIDDIDGADAFMISLLPNPAGDVVTVHLERVEAQRVSLLNLLGQELWSADGMSGASTIDINLSELERGVYLVKVESVGGVYTRRLVHN